MTTFASITALLLGLAILVLGNGLQNILLPTRAAIEAFPVTVIGLMFDLVGWAITVKLLGADCYGIGCLFD